LDADAMKEKACIRNVRQWGSRDIERGIFYVQRRLLWDEVGKQWPNNLFNAITMSGSGPATATFSSELWKHLVFKIQTIG
jgi:hypothetical protein